MTYPGQGQSFGDSGVPATRTATVVLDANVNGYSQQMAQAAQSTNALSGSVSGLADKLHGLDKYAGKKLFHFAAADFAVFGSAAADAATFEKQLGTLSATSAITGTNMKALKAGIESTFTHFATSRSDVIALTTALTNLGVTGAGQVTQLTRTFIKLGAATGESSVALATGLTQLSRLMGVTDAKQITNMANSLLTVSKAAGVSTLQVLDFSQAIAPMARQAGIGQAAIMGISSAFAKAGADGYVAANVFNQIMGDMSRLSASGSTDLAKYANLIGVTTDQFKKMDKATAFTKTVTALAKQGAGAGNTLADLGVADSTRGQAAVTALYQSGDLQKQINLAVGAQGDQGNLDKGASAAMNNLADSLAVLRNNFTELGTVIGTTFLKPLTMATDTMTGFVHALTAGIKPFSSMIGMAGVGGGVLAGAGGLALNAAGLIGTVALGKMITTGSHMTAFKGGFAASRNYADLSKLNKRDAESLERYTSGKMSAAQARMFEMGMGPARIIGPVAKPGQKIPALHKLETWRNLGIAAPFRFVQALNGGTASMLRESTRDAWDRLRYRDEQPRITMRERFNRMVAQTAGLAPLDVVGQEGLRTMNSVGNVTGAYTQAGSVFGGRMLGRLARYGAPRMMTSLLSGMIGVPYAGHLMNTVQGSAPPGTVGEAGRAFADESKKFWYNLGAATRHPISSLGVLGTSAKETAVALKNLAMKSTGYVAVQGLRGVGAAGSAVFGGAWELTKALGRFAFSIPGALTMVGGKMLYDRYSAGEKQAQFKDGDFNPIQKYNDLLGTTTSNLATFSQTLADATTQTKASQYGDASSMKAAAVVNEAVMTNHPGKPAANVWNDIDKNPRTMAGVLGTMQISDPKQLRLAEADMAAAGANMTTIQDAVNIWQHQMGGANWKSGIANHPMYRMLGTAAAGTEGSDDGNQSTRGRHILAAGMTSIDAQRIADEQTKGGMYAQQKALAGYVELLTPMVRKYADQAATGEGGGAAKDALAKALSKVTAGGEGGYESTIRGGGKGDKKFNEYAGMSRQEAEKSVITLMQSTKEGRKWLSSLDIGKGASLDPAKFDSALINLANTSDGSDFNSQLRRRGGALGRFAAGNDTVQGAIGIYQGQAGAVQGSINNLAGYASKISGNDLGSAQAKLVKELGVIGDTSSPLYQQMSAAQQQLDQQEQFNAPFRSRKANFHQAVSDYHAAAEAYNSTPQDQRTPEQYAFLQQKKQGYQQALQSQQQYQQQVYQAALSFGTQMTRAAEDESTQEAHSKRDFYYQMANMAFDFQRQQSRAKYDFGLQQSRATEDFHREQRRAQEDFDRQAAQQAEVAAQSIYNPYLRVQSQYTADSGTLVQNMQDQNQRLAQQSHQLHELQARGLSKQAIQTLNLADPNNAQQLNELVAQGGISQSQIRQLNRQAQRRVGLTAGLTNNPLNLSFDQSQRNFSVSMGRAQDDFQRSMSRSSADFATSMSRAQEDYDTSRERSFHQFHVGMQDMKDAYNRQVKRAGEDLQVAMAEITGNFGSMYNKTMQQIAKSVETFSPKAAAQMRTDIGGIVQEFPWLADVGGNVTNYDGKPTVTTPNTIGINPKGVVGAYDEHGVFHKANMSYDRNMLPPIAPQSAQPAAHHHGAKNKRAMATGGISTHDQEIRISEGNRSEAVIPLDERGARFMSGFVGTVTREVLQRLHTGGLPGMPTGGGGVNIAHISEDHSLNFTGSVHVEASDPNDMARKLEAKARLQRLSRPARTGR